MTELSQSTVMPTTEVQVKGRWRQLSLLGGTMLVDSTEASLVSSLFPLIRQSLGVSLGALGVLTASGKIVGAFTGPFWVWAAQRWSRKSVLVVATGLWGVWGVAAGFSQNFAQLLVLYTVLAAGYAAAHPIITELIGDLFGGSTRGRAVGVVYGAVSLVSAVIGPLKGQLAGVDEGWRWGLWGIGAFNIVLGIALWIWFRDPGRGAAERQLADLDRATRDAHSKLTWHKALSLLKIRSLVLLLVSRLLSGHLLVGTFGVVFLVDVYGFSTQKAAIVLLPFGIGYFLGTLLGGVLADWATRRSPRHGLVAVLQAAQIVFALVAFFGTQFDYGSIGLFGLFFALMGATQGVNPSVNRPMVMAITPPELRGAAFALYVSIFEAIAWAAFSLGAGFLGDALGLRTVFLWALVILMLINGAFLTLLYLPYADDVARVQRELQARRDQALGRST
ncbi:MFS transporter [Streptomyces sp. VRA16 Mangrove soil]|uniref:MFS transporter n=1 Tax=Streptomyces sp. VRA16 Mangrove soil TaxID=2817434 RepID=UPI001A9F60C6|nr:MFS transporter [Streptomyces sp. VRA16 Mangrove soil]MBO1331337.1 MFS transporter [Streptomyces sp. VRA16 Mangrove soil]